MSSIIGHVYTCDAGIDTPRNQVAFILKKLGGNSISSEADRSVDERIYLYHQQQLLTRGARLSWKREELAIISDLEKGLIEIEADHSVRHLAYHCDESTSAEIAADMVPLRQILLEQGEETFRVPGLGNQLLSWLQTHQFCGACGSPTRMHSRERAVVCVECGHVYYPRINPCVIVLVQNGHELLLARHQRYKSRYFSCLAGFIEVGETAEQAIMREIKEEAGIEVENIRYVKSQSWPFPSQLMLGFFASYKTGVLRPDMSEISELRWFTPDSLPEVPSAEISVSGQLIKIHCDHQV